MRPTITPHELASSIEAGHPPAVLDVRDAAEFEQGRVPGSVNVPYWRLLAPGADLPVPPEDRLVIYCGHGPRAQIARTALRIRGYRQTILMTGHWAAWQQAGLPEERSGS
jgi:hydroxyacylglutathione hydrolase